MTTSPNKAQQLMEQGLWHHQRMQLPQAKALYESALRLHADHPGVWHLLAVVSLQTGQATQALEQVQRALAVMPEIAVFWSTQGNALKELNRLDEAVQSYDKAIALDPQFADAYSNKGVALRRMQHWQEALACYEQATAIHPEHADAWLNRGVVLQLLGRGQEALQSYDQALAIQPRETQAWANRGGLLKELGDLSGALHSYDQAMAIEPQNASLFYNKGVAWQHFLNAKEAIVCYEQAIRLMPRYAQAFYNCGVAWQSLSQSKEAIACYEQAIGIEPGYAQAHYNRGVALQSCLRLDDAEGSYKRAIELNPQYAQAHLNLSLIQLLRGHYIDGWRSYEWRWNPQATALRQRNWERPTWRGEGSLKGQTIVLHAEQGLGDCIQFARYVPMVKALGARVVLQVPDVLWTLMHSLQGVDEWVRQDQALPEFDWQCPLMSLPLAFGTTLETIPSGARYLSVDTPTSDLWRQRVQALGVTGKRKIGLVWHGGFRAQQPELWEVNARRNVELAVLAQALQSVDAVFFSLQKGEPAQSQIHGQEHVYWPRHNFVNWANDLSDFAHTAALIEQLDLVISVDTSTAHVAAALGKPVWLLNRHDSCWRWLLEREDSPWYPSVRVYRQGPQRDWGEVLARVRLDLEQSHLA